MPTLSELIQELTIAQANAIKAAKVAVQAKEKANNATAKRYSTKNPNIKLRNNEVNTAKAAHDAQANAVKTAATAKQIADQVTVAIEAYKKAANSKIAAANSKITAEHAEFVTKLSAIAKGLNHGKSSLAKQETAARQAIYNTFNNSPIKVAHDLRKSDQITKAAIKPSSHGGAANKAAQAALAKIKQPSSVNRVVTSILNAIKTAAKVAAKIIAAPFVLTNKAIVALGQDIAKVAKAVNPIAAYKKHQAKKAAVVQEAQDFEASFGQGLIDAMTALTEANAEAVAKVVARAYRTQQSIAAAKITPPSSPSGSQPIAPKSPKAQEQAPDSDGPEGHQVIYQN